MYSGVLRNKDGANDKQRTTRRRRVFTLDEDRIIKNNVMIIGEKWKEIAKKLVDRTPKQVHDRYSNYLRAGIKISPWSEDEDKKVIKLVDALGPKWSRIMNSLPGRSSIDIKNRWDQLRRNKEFLSMDSKSKNIKPAKIAKLKGIPSNTYAYPQQNAPNMLSSFMIPTQIQQQDNNNYQKNGFSNSEERGIIKNNNNISTSANSKVTECNNGNDIKSSNIIEKKDKTNDDLKIPNKNNKKKSENQSFVLTDAEFERMACEFDENSEFY